MVRAWAREVTGVDYSSPRCYSNSMDNTEHTMQAVDTRSFEEISNTPMTELEELENIYCEMHKDVYGVKARWYRAASVEQARKDIESLSAALEAQMEQDRQFQQEAIAAFNQLVASYGYENAKRYQHQAYSTDGTDDHLEYCLGLPYKYFAKREAEAQPA